MTRRALSTFACLLSTALVAPSLSGCLTPSYAMQPGSLKKGSRVHAFQTASFGYSFSNALAAQWKGTIKRVEQDAIPLLTALRDGGHAMQIIVTPRISNEGNAKAHQTEYYDVDLMLVPAKKEAAPGKKGGKDAAAAPKPFVIRGKAGTSPSVYKAAAAEAGKALSLDPDLVQKGHFAIYGLVNMMTAINASNDSLQRHAFALLVLREKVKNGEKADWFGGNRPPEETLEDTLIALRVIADHHAAMASFRAEVLGITAIANAYRAPEAIDELRAQLRETAQRNDAWIASHHQPTQEEFGVAMNEFKLPTPDAMLEQLDEHGYIAASIKIAKGLASGDASTTLDGLSKLAPPDSSLRTVLEGAAAVSKGDIMGTVGAVSKLAGKEAEVSALTSRLGKLNSALAATKGGAAQVASALGKPPGDLDGLRKAADSVSEGVEGVKQGVDKGRDAARP